MAKKQNTPENIETKSETPEAISEGTKALEKEFISAEDNAELQDVKKKVVEADETVKSAQKAAQDLMEKVALQKQNAEMKYENTILKLAMKHNLRDGDLVNSDGSIERK